MWLVIFSHREVKSFLSSSCSLSFLSMRNTHALPFARSPSYMGLIHIRLTQPNSRHFFIPSTVLPAVDRLIQELPSKQYLHLEMIFPNVCEYPVLPPHQLYCERQEYSIEMFPSHGSERGITSSVGHRELS